MHDITHRAGDQTAADVDRRRFRSSYMRANAFELWIALAAALTGITFLVEPAALSNSVVAENTGWLGYAWGGLYAAGGIFTVAGLALPSIRIELAGLSLLGSMALIDGMALLLVRGPAGIRIAMLYLALPVAAAMRAQLVARLARVG